MSTTHEYLAPDTLGYRITNADPRRGYRIVKEVIADPRQPCVLIHTRLEADPAVLAKRNDTDSTFIGTGHEYVDICVPAAQKAPVRFTFWTTVGHWEGRDFEVGVDRRGM